MLPKAAFITICLLFYATDAFAVQEHGGAEGYVVHQIAHLIFLASMIFMARVLRRPMLSRASGWRYIRYAALFLILWNIDTFINHIADRQLVPDEEYFRGSALILKDYTAYVYYVTRLAENFLLVPAFIFLAVGLHRLWRHFEEVSP